MLFTNAHCASPKCAPSRAAIMTGLKPSTTGLYDNGHWWMPNLPDVVTLPMHFRKQGYQVVGAGKIFHHTAGNNPPNQWDDFFRLTFRNDPWFRSVKKNYPWSKSGPNPSGFPFSRVNGLGHENDWGSLNIEDQLYDDSLTADYAIKFLSQQHDRPYFLACGFFRPHLPWYVPPQFFDLYPLAEIELPKVSKDDLNDVPAQGKRFATARQSDLQAIQNANRWQHAVQAYLASISYADHQVGRVLDALEARGDDKNTVICLWSDHGWHLGEKQHWHKSTLWEEATRVPFIISAPGLEAGACDQPVSLLDLFPTLNDVCQLPAIATHDGMSLLPLLREPKSDWERPAVIEYQLGNSAVRSRRFRYIQYHDGGEELYDLKQDPYEWKNLAEHPDYAATKKKLAAWSTQNWAKSALTKKAFQFDPDNYRWTNNESGEVTEGK